ncbi:unnamed protein product [Parnassius apollo]|uniref:(apollo) hypothetical protein n=1 Tax=Parnassius apollo TaxID=110799 RepID=A0A8S3Y1G0_PARAO|nr:unnamed protein product [Parnassius apollo]
MKKWSPTRTITAVAVVMSVRKPHLRAAGQSPSLKCPRQHPSRLKLKLKSSEGVRVHSSSQDEESMLPPETLTALGEGKTSEEIFEQKIPTEVSKRWGKILIEGLTKEQKENFLTKTLILEYFQLAKAPRLNAKFVSVINESPKNRYRRLEKMQN